MSTNSMPLLPQPGMRGGIERLLRELSTALVEEGDDRLVLLSDERDEIRLAVAVEIGDRHVDRAVSLVDHARHELGLGPVRWSGSPGGGSRRVS